jgi:REP element-mobilizing transposase RayT
MNFKNNFLKTFSLTTLCSLLVVPNWTFSAEANISEEQLPSPYFIDGVHCEGFKFETESSWPYKEETAKEAKRAQIESACKGFFNSYGIELFQWYTPENLESLSNTIRKAEEFYSVELNIKKSELPNHIHLFLKTVPKTVDSKIFRMESRSYKGRGDEGGRTTQILGFDWTNNKNYPIATSSFGFKHFNSKANSPVDLKGSQISDLNKDIINISSYHATDIYGAFSLPYGRYGFGMDMAIHFLPNNINSAHKTLSDSYYTLVFTNKQKSLLGNSEIGLILDHSTVYNFYYDPMSKSDQTTNQDRAGLLLKFASGNLRGDYIGSSVTAYAPRSRNDKSVAIYDIDFRWTMAGAVPQAYFAFKGVHDESNDIGLYRRYIAEQNNSMEIGVNKYLKISNSDAQLSAFLGNVALIIPEKSGVDSEFRYGNETGYVGIKGKIETNDGWNVEAKFGIYDGRLQ